jgi:hypothetical protein
MSLIGTLLPRANPAACPQLAKGDFASSSQYVREGQRIAELEAEDRCAAAVSPGVLGAAGERGNVRIRRKETCGR